MRFSVEGYAEPSHELLRAWEVRNWLSPLFSGGFSEYFLHSLLRTEKIAFFKKPGAKPWYRKARIKQELRLLFSDLSAEQFQSSVGPLMPPKKLPTWIGRADVLKHVGIPGKELDSWVGVGLVKAQRGRPWREPRYSGSDLKKILVG
jgi:hypothetical protein